MLKTIKRWAERWRRPQRIRRRAKCPVVMDERYRRSLARMGRYAALSERGTALKWAVGREALLLARLALTEDGTAESLLRLLTEEINAGRSGPDEDKR